MYPPHNVLIICIQYTASFPKKIEFHSESLDYIWEFFLRPEKHLPPCTADAISPLLSQQVFFPIFFRPFAFFAGFWYTVKSNLPTGGGL